MLGFAWRYCVRRAWLWRNRSRFGQPAAAAMPRLFVDVSTIIRHDAQTGIQRVVRAVWSDLQRRNGQDFDLVPVYATQSRGYCYAPTDFLDQTSTRPFVEPVAAGPGDRFLGLDLAAHVLPRYCQQVRAWRRHGASVHLVVYDLLPILKPQWFNDRATAHFKNWFRVLVEDADQAVCISEQVARDLLNRMRDFAPNSTLAVAHFRLGGDIASSRPSAGISAQVSDLLDRLRFRPAILMVGTVEPRKAYDIALAAFEHLWATRGGEAPDLVIVGKAGWQTAALQQRLRAHPEHGRRLHWFDSVTDEGLSKLYEVCRGLLMASHGEGFGLPLAEAMVHGRYVLARDLPVFREQNLSNILYFNDDRAEPLGARILELAVTGPLGSEAKNSSLNWHDSVTELLATLGLDAAASTVTGHSSPGRKTYG